MTRNGYPLEPRGYHVEGDAPPDGGHSPGSAYSHDAGPDGMGGDANEWTLRWKMARCHAGGNYAFRLVVEQPKQLLRPELHRCDAASHPKCDNGPALPM